MARTRVRRDSASGNGPAPGRPPIRQVAGVMIGTMSEYDPRAGEEVETWVARLTWSTRPTGHNSRHHHTDVTGTSLADVMTRLANLMASGGAEEVLRSASGSRLSE